MLSNVFHYAWSQINFQIFKLSHVDQRHFIIVLSLTKYFDSLHNLLNTFFNLFNPGTDFSRQNPTSIDSDSDV